MKLNGNLRTRLHAVLNATSTTPARGMTLIEIMVVILIIGMVSGIVAVGVIPQFEQAKIDTTRVQIQNFQQALDHYKIRVGKYPTTSEGLEALTNPPKNMQPILTEIPRDPWQNDYVYVSPGVNSKAGYDIESYGPDGVDGGNDDIESWNLQGDAEQK